MSGFEWYPGAKAKLDTAIKESLIEAANDMRDDLVGSGLLPYDADGDGSSAPGTLQSMTTVDTSKADKKIVSIVSDTEYATKLYYHPDYQFDKGVNANARALWFHPYMARGGKRGFVPNSFSRHMKAKVGK